MTLEIREILEPVIHWYQSDEHPGRRTSEIVKDVVADLQNDRANCLRLISAGRDLVTAANLVSAQLDDGGVTEGAHMKMARATTAMIQALGAAKSGEVDGS
jgi:hypothetical protein